MSSTFYFTSSVCYFVLAMATEWLTHMHIGIVGTSEKPCMLDKIMTSYKVASTAARMTLVLSFKGS